MPREALRDIQNLLVTVAEPGLDLRSSHFSLCPLFLQPSWPRLLHQFFVLGLVVPLLCLVFEHSKFNAMNANYLFRAFRTILPLFSATDWVIYQKIHLFL